jgi:5-methylcytosine-specific restriction endonuclease McrA
VTTAELRADIRARDRGGTDGPDRCIMPGWMLAPVKAGPHGGAMHVHHRVRRSQGGQDEPWNLITLCAAHHSWVHANPYAARRLGYLLASHADPATVPVDHTLWPAGPVLLGAELDFTLWDAGV